MRIPFGLSFRSILGPVKREALQRLFGDFVIGVDVLDVVIVLQRLDQLHQRVRRVAFDQGGVERTPLQLCFLRLAELRLERIAHRGEVVDRAGDLVAGSIAFDIVGAGFEPGSNIASAPMVAPLAAFAA